MPLVKTLAEFRTEIRLEGKVNDNSEDTTILTILNDVLIEICSSTKNVRDLRFDQTATHTAGVVSFPVYIREIEQAYYQKFNAGVFSRRWELTEQSGMIVPAPIPGPDAYTITQASTPATQMMTIKLYPLGSAIVGDMIQIVGTGFKFLAADADPMPYVSFYPMLKRATLQRLQIKRNMDPNRTMSFDKSIERATFAAGMGAADVGGNTVRDAQ